MIEYSKDSGEASPGTDENFSKQALPSRSKVELLGAKALAFLSLVTPFAGLAGCSQSYSSVGTLTKEEIDSLSETASTYHNINERGVVSADLTLAGLNGEYDAEDLSAMHNRAPGSGLASAQLVLLHSLSGESESKVQEIYERIASSREASSNLVTAAILGKKDIQEINRLFEIAAATHDTSSILVLASVLSGKSISAVNEMYSQAPHWVNREGAAELVLAASLTNRSMQEMAELYKGASSSGEVSARLAVLAAVHDKSIDQVNSIYDNTLSFGMASAALTEAVLISGKSVAEINHQYQLTRAWSGEGGANLVVAWALRCAAKEGRHFNIIPVVYRDQHGKTSSDHMVNLILPRRAETPGIQMSIEGD